MTKAELVAERHGNIKMLSELLETSRGYDRLAQDCNAKKAEINRLDRELAKPRPQKYKPLMIFIIGLVTCAIGWIVFAILLNKDKKEWEARVADLQAKKAAAQKAYEAACAALKKYDDEVFTPAIASLIPDTFSERYARSSFAIEYMLDLLINLRADTIREAINLYEECMYRTRMENCMNRVVESAAATARSAARSAAANESAAQSAAVSAAAAVATASSMASIAESERRMAAESERTGRYLRS